MQVDRQLAALLDVLLASPDGKTLAEIAARLNEALSRRTLNRRLAELERRGQVARRGKGRRVRYYPIRNVQQPPQGQVVDRPEWISKVGLEIQTHVCQPLSGRRPVGYQRSLLADYQPNQTRYLGSRLSAHLSELGSPISPERPSGTFARDILGRILIDLSWASSRLEGNTYSRLDTQRLVEFGQVAEGKDAVETQMILNHKAAIELLVEGIEEVGFNAYTFLNLHALLSENLLADPLASGRLRQRPVEIAASPYVPTAVPQLIEECFQEILRKAAQVADPFEQAFFLLVHIPYLQPFEDVNKRVSRLGANIPFIKNNLSPLSFVDVPENLLCRIRLGRLRASSIRAIARPVRLGLRALLPAVCRDPRFGGRTGHFPHALQGSLDRGCGRSGPQEPGGSRAGCPRTRSPSGRTDAFGALREDGLHGPAASTRGQHRTLPAATIGLSSLETMRVSCAEIAILVRLQ